MARSLVGTAVRLAAAGALLVGCSSPPPGPFTNAPSPAVVDAGAEPPREGGGIVITPTPPDLGAKCDPARSVASDGFALLERDPAALAAFSLERVLARLIATAGDDASLTPLELLQRLFDTMNTAQLGVFTDNVHCNDSRNAAFQNAPPADCPRAEGVLATSSALLARDSLDSFVPVAVVNRFDLAAQNFPTCGEFRLVYAKQSGRTEPRNRLLMIFESVLPNPRFGIAGCRPVADFWASLEAIPSAAERGARLEQFLFDGLPGFTPVVHARNFGIDQGQCRYQQCGRLRLGMGMQEPWDFREFRLQRRGALDTGPGSHFAPVPLNDSPVPSLFDFAGADPKLPDFRSTLLWWSRQLGPATRVAETRLVNTDPFFNAGDSALAGAARPNFLDRVRQSPGAPALIADIDKELATLPQTCPADDPVTHEAVLQRITALTCAGCHAPRALLSETRGVGCGMVWPNSLGEAHIDENGMLSEALVQTLLPHRAEVFSTYLQACDERAILDKFQPPTTMSCFVAGTPIMMADGSVLPIERIAVGDRVLTFDTRRAVLAAGLVTRTFVHPDSGDLVAVNGTLVATGGHPFYSAGSWVRADSLAPGSSLLTAVDVDPTTAIRLQASADEVRSLAKREGKATTYNFEVAIHHAYFAGGILVHNKPPVP